MTPPSPHVIRGSPAATVDLLKSSAATAAWVARLTAAPAIAALITAGLLTPDNLATLRRSEAANFTRALALLRAAGRLTPSEVEALRTPSIAVARKMWERYPRAKILGEDGPPKPPPAGPANN